MTRTHSSHCLERNPMSNPGSRSTHRSAISASSASLSDVQSLVPTSNGMACSVLVPADSGVPAPAAGDDAAHLIGPGVYLQDTGCARGWPNRRADLGVRAWARPRRRDERGGRNRLSRWRSGPAGPAARRASPRRLSTLNSAGSRRTVSPTWRKTGSSPGLSRSSCFSRSTLSSVRIPSGSPHAELGRPVDGQLGPRRPPCRPA